MCCWQNLLGILVEPGRSCHCSEDLPHCRRPWLHKHLLQPRNMAMSSCHIGSGPLCMYGIACWMGRTATHTFWKSRQKSEKVPGTIYCICCYFCCSTVPNGNTVAQLLFTAVIEFTIYFWHLNIGCVKSVLCQIYYGTELLTLFILASQASPGRVGVHL